MTWIWIIFAAAILVAGVRHRMRIRAMRRRRGAPVVDDEAIRRIIGTGQLPRRDDDARNDLKEAARAEDEFWAESWDEPEEFRP